ncbi:hypothetical protein FN846DRAFT_1008371 [Sphaerosporella brunnea]|uniref:Uncharacterized protein n=1 Tax=Sphaerosporella brunnea TaxID=1250544 RepID=A0A5J5F2J6_9PEZI|nr:hypothetical protein FN846DRAFT_1008371 [Sphaerosporella brunnea]
MTPKVVDPQAHVTATVEGIAGKPLKWSALSFRPLTKAESTSIYMYERKVLNKIYFHIEEHGLDCSPLGGFGQQDGLAHLYHQSIKDYICQKVVRELEDLEFFSEVCMANLRASETTSTLENYACLYVRYWFQYITPTSVISAKLLRQLRPFYALKTGAYDAWLKRHYRLAFKPDKEIDFGGFLNPLHLAAHCGQQDLVVAKPLSPFKHFASAQPCKMEGVIIEGHLCEILGLLLSTTSKCGLLQPR